MRTALPARLAAGLLAAGVLLGHAPAPRAQTAVARTVTEAQYERWKKELSNWGRWGKDDEIGALNLITPAKRKQAATLVKDGVSVSLSADADTVQAVDNPTPYDWGAWSTPTQQLKTADTFSSDPAAVALFGTLAHRPIKVFAVNSAGHLFMGTDTAE